MSRPKAVIGVDPGAQGAGVLLTQDHRIERCRFMKYTHTEVFQVFLWWACAYECEAMFELIRYMPKDKGKDGEANNLQRMATFLRNTGRSEGFLIAAGIPFEEIYSRTWQNEFGLGALAEHERKAKHQEKAQELFPNLRITRDEADAILIAEYKWRSKFGRMLREKGKR